MRHFNSRSPADIFRAYILRRSALRESRLPVCILLACILLAAAPAPVPARSGSDELLPDQRGSQLQKTYLDLDVEHRWTAGMHVNWETGESDRPDAKAGNHTHCSAFVAAACEKMDIYILRPPQHGQLLLANAQYDWLSSQEARTIGWKPLTGDDLPLLYLRVQQLANTGHVIVAVIKNPDDKQPGHIALVIPKKIDAARVIEEGPVVIMAGKHNFNYISLQHGFKSHLTSWPSADIKFYIH